MDLTCSSDTFHHQHDVTSTSLMLGSASSPLTVKLGSLLLLLLGVQDQASAVISNVSVIQSWNWFFHLSAFESVFLMIVIVQVSVLNMVGILPINLSEFWTLSNGADMRRKKRRVSPLQSSQQPHVAQLTKEIGTKMLKLYKKLDYNECGFRALCELQNKVIFGNFDKRRLPRGTQLVLTTLLRYADQPSKMEESGNEEREGEPRVDIIQAVQPYAEAIKIGSQSQQTKNFNADIYYGNVTNTPKYENACHRKYPACPATSDELMEYIERINVLEY